MAGEWRTVYGSDHHLGEHSDASAEMVRGCAATKFIPDPKNQTRMYMVTGRPSGFKEYLCEQPPGPAEHGWDGCRRYLYDDTKLLAFDHFWDESKTKGAVLDAHAADPEAPWLDMFKHAADYQEEQFSKILPVMTGEEMTKLIHDGADKDELET